MGAKLHTFEGYVQELQKCVGLTNTPILKHLDHINSLLHNVVLTCRAAMATQAAQPIPSLATKEYIAPGQNLQQQPRARGFTKTTEPPGRKKKGLVLRLYMKQ